MAAAPEMMRWAHSLSQSSLIAPSNTWTWNDWGFRHGRKDERSARARDRAPGLMRPAGYISVGHRHWAGYQKTGWRGSGGGWPNTNTEGNREWPCHTAPALAASRPLEMVACCSLGAARDVWRMALDQLPPYPSLVTVVIVVVIIFIFAIACQPRILDEDRRLVLELLLRALSLARPPRRRRGRVGRGCGRKS